MTKQIFTRDEVKALLREALNEGWKDNPPMHQREIDGMSKRAQFDKAWEKNKRFVEKSKREKTKKKNSNPKEEKTFTREEVEAIIRKDREARSKQ